MKILSIVAARPNFMKIAPLHRAFQEIPSIESKIVHTGQHYDERMSDIFFNQLELPKPHFYLGVNGGSHTWQKAQVMLKFEMVLQNEKPDLVIVVGDVNATAACSIVSVKMGIKTIHIEAGLRSLDRNMPEEINRIITDAICDGLFVTEHSALVNLAKEGVPDKKVFFVGNLMIDSLMQFRIKAAQTTVLEDLKIQAKEYVLMTMHRPANVDKLIDLKRIIEIIKDTVYYKTVVFPIHPRTAKSFKKHQLWDELLLIKNLILAPPYGYLEFLKLMENAALIITDSGGIQEETTFLQVPCLTFRNSTERPITALIGTNILMADLNPQTVKEQVEKILNGKTKKGTIPPFWDGHTAYRIIDILLEKFSLKQNLISQ